MEEGTKAEVHMYKDVTGVLDVLKPNLDRDTIVLIKGPMSSRAMIEFANCIKDINKIRKMKHSSSFYYVLIASFNLDV